MRLSFLKLPSEERRLYFDQAAQRRGLSPVILEKDFWRERVVHWKSQFFGSAWARYDLARPGTFKLAPPSARIPALRRDYQAMRDMYLSEPVELDRILSALADLELRINSESRE